MAAGKVSESLAQEAGKRVREGVGGAKKPAKAAQAGHQCGDQGSRLGAPEKHRTCLGRALPSAGDTVGHSLLHRDIKDLVLGSVCTACRQSAHQALAPELCKGKATPWVGAASCLEAAAPCTLRREQCGARAACFPRAACGSRMAQFMRDLCTETFYNWLLPC